ncbi:MAG: (d)CMP kinase [Acetomicrobium sp.]
MRKRKIITIDGPAGSGKSSVAKRVAQELGFVHLDSGAIYRAVTLFLLQRGVSPSDVPKIEECLKDLDLEVKDQQIYVNGENVTEAIRSPQVDEMVSLYSALPVIRSSLLALQRELQDCQDLIAEGRDMGTVVFPDADLKIFLKADAKTRAIRRWKELMERGVDISFDDVYYQIIQRDEKDSNRELSPLIPAEDAIILDTSDLTLDEVVERVIKLVKDHIEQVKRCDA